MTETEDELKLYKYKVQFEHFIKESNYDKS